MRIRLWHAFAGNNSGSYTIVGRFREAAQADEVVRLLAPLLADQTRWFEDPARARPSPLERLAIAESLEWDADDEEWPQYGGKAAPEVLRAGNQVLIHHDYTVTLPRFFGRLFYARGGAVDTMVDHAHGRLVVLFRVWWHGQNLTEERRAELSRSLAAALRAEGSPLRSHSVEGVEPIVREFGSGFALDVFRIHAVFRDLVAGVEAVRALIEKHGGRFDVNLTEEMDANVDPLASARRPGERRGGE